MARGTIATLAVLGLLFGQAPSLRAQPDLGVPFTYDCIVWKEAFDPLPERARRDVATAIGSVLFAGAVAFLDLQEILDLPFDPKLVIIGFFAAGTAVSLVDYWVTSERIEHMRAKGRELGCL